MSLKKAKAGDLARAVSSQIRALRQESGMSYDAIVSTGAIGKNRLGIILRDEGPAINVDELAALAAVFGTTASQIVRAAEMELGAREPAAGAGDRVVEFPVDYLDSLAAKYDDEPLEEPEFP